MTNYSALHYSEKARKAAVGTIEEYPDGSAKYWAEQAEAIVNIKDASETEKGIAMLATQAEALAGANDTKIMTPAKVAVVAQELHDDIDDVAQYAKDLKERVDEIELFKFPNATIIGNPTINNGQISGFTANDYLQFPFELDLTNRRLRVEFVFTTNSNVTTQQNVMDSQFGIALAIANGKGLMAVSSNGTSWNIGSSVGTMTIQPNTTYYARMTWDGLQYKTFLSTNGIDYVQDMTLVSNQRPYPRTIFIGGCSGSAIGHDPHPFLGTINLNRAFLYLNDVLIWQGMDDAGLATRADVSLDNLDAVGQAKFDAKQDVISDLETIRTGAGLGATALQSITSSNVTTALGFTPAKSTDLTTHTGNGTIHVTASDKIAWSQKQERLVSGTNIKTIGGNSLLGSGDIEVGADIPSMTLAEYNAIPHDPEQYYAITDDTDTGLNLLQMIYPVGSVYLTYNLVCPLSELFGTWQLVGQGIVSSVSDTASVQGTGMTLGLTDGTSNVGFGTSEYSGWATTNIRESYYNTPTGSSTGSYQQSRYKTLGITTDPTKSGMIANVSSQTLQLNIFRRVA